MILILGAAQTPAPPLQAILGMTGPWEFVVILLVILVLFGNRLPSMARNLGRSMTEFKKGVKGDPEPEKLPRERDRERDRDREHDREREDASKAHREP